MKKIGLTGNIGSGKSIVAEIFKIIGVNVYQADENARRLLFESPQRDKVIQCFGDEVMDGKGFLSRDKLAGIVFPDPNKLEKLNEIIHPAVMNDFQQWLQHHAVEKYILHEAAILFETGFNLFFDKVICVYAPSYMRIQRVIQRDGASREEVMVRMQRQWPDEKKNALADFLIRNDETQLLIPRVLHIHNEILHACSS